MTFVTLTNWGGYASDVYQGRGMAKGTPSPFRGRATVRLPPSKFFYFSKQIFYFFLPIPIISSIHPFFLSLRGFIFLCVYFPICASFRVSEGKKMGKIGIVFLSYLCLCSYYTLYSHFLLFSPVIFLSVLCFCIVFCCGCCVFR